MYPIGLQRGLLLKITIPRITYQQIAASGPVLIYTRWLMKLCPGDAGLSSKIEPLYITSSVLCAVSDVQ